MGDGIYVSLTPFHIHRETLDWSGARLCDNNNNDIASGIASQNIIIPVAILKFIDRPLGNWVSGCIKGIEILNINLYLVLSQLPENHYIFISRPSGNYKWVVTWLLFTHRFGDISIPPKCFNGRGNGAALWALLLTK